jgi:hypothetical protein
MRRAVNTHRREGIDQGVRGIKALVAAALVVALAAIWLIPPEDSIFPACAFHSLTGHSCLTCGLTRSLYAMAHGDLITSLQYHIVGPVIFLGMILCSFVLLFEAITGIRTKLTANGKGTNRVILLLTIVWLVYWGARVITEVLV